MAQCIRNRRSNIEIKENVCSNPIFGSKEEMNKSLSRLCYGNLHVIGRLWIEGLSKVLVGKKMCLIPTVKAAPPEEVPIKPPKMRCKDLSVYDSPHADYAQYHEDKECLRYNEKLLQKAALPTVESWRQGTAENICSVKNFFAECIDEIAGEIKCKKEKFKRFMRHDDRLEARQALVATATAAGLILGSRKNCYVYQKLFWGSVGGLSTGWLCFPCETNKVVVTALNKLNWVRLRLYKFWSRGDWFLPMEGPCAADMPAKPPQRKIEKCQAPKKK